VVPFDMEVMVPKDTDGFRIRTESSLYRAKKHKATWNIQHHMSISKL